MPTQFLSRSEIERLESFPEEIDRDELAEHFVSPVRIWSSFVRSTGPRGSSESRCSCAR